MQININLKVNSPQSDQLQLTDYQFSKTQKNKSTSTTKPSSRKRQQSVRKQNPNKQSQYENAAKCKVNSFFQNSSQCHGYVKDRKQLKSLKQLQLFDLKNLNILETIDNKKVTNATQNKSSLKIQLSSKFNHNKKHSLSHFPIAGQQQKIQLFSSKDIKLRKKVSQNANMKKNQGILLHSKKKSRSNNKNKIKYTQNKDCKFNFNFIQKQDKILSTNNNSKFSAKKSTNLFEDSPDGKIKSKVKGFLMGGICHSNSLNFEDEGYRGSLPGISGKKALQRYAPLLSQNQKDELVNQKTVYYIGVGVSSGQDDKQGSYIWRKHEQIGYRYQLLEALGKGAFGQVVKSFDHKTKQFVAIKIIRAKRQNMQLAMNEINILMKTKQKDIQNQKNIVKIKDFIVFRKHICIVTELLSLSLYDLLESNQFKPIQIQYIRTFAIQILNALSFLKENKIIHSDIKPQNVLLKSKLKTGVKVIDFGTSMFINQAHYSYIQSRFYRSPEIILGGKYDYSIDMWSFGCLLVEMYIGRPLFPGRTQVQQFSLIIQTLGLPQTKFLENCKNYQRYFHKNGFLKANQYSNKIIPKSQPLSLIISTDEQFLDFIKQIIRIDPKQRLTPYKALIDPFILKGLPKSMRQDHKKYIYSKIKSELKNDEIQCNQTTKKDKQKQQYKLLGSKHKKRKSDILKISQYQHNRRRSDGCRF